MADVILTTTDFKALYCPCYFCGKSNQPELQVLKTLVESKSNS